MCQVDYFKSSLSSRAANRAASSLVSIASAALRERHVGVWVPSNGVEMSHDWTRGKTWKAHNPSPVAPKSMRYWSLCKGTQETNRFLQGPARRRRETSSILRSIPHIVEIGIFGWGRRPLEDCRRRAHSALADRADFGRWTATRVKDVSSPGSVRSRQTFHKNTVEQSPSWQEAFPMHIGCAACQCSRKLFVSDTDKGAIIN
jgi:hypothetical protein